MKEIVPIAGSFLAENTLEGFDLEMQKLKRQNSNYVLYHYDSYGKKSYDFKLKVVEPVEKVIIGGKDFTRHTIGNKGENTYPNIEITHFTPAKFFYKYSVKKEEVTGREKVTHLNFILNQDIENFSKFRYVLISPSFDKREGFTSLNALTSYFLSCYKKDKYGVDGKQIFYSSFTLYDQKLGKVYNLGIKKERVKSTKLTSNDNLLVVPIYENFYFGYVYKEV